MNFIVILASKLDLKTFEINPKEAVVKLIKIHFEPFSNLIQEDLSNNMLEGNNVNTVHNIHNTSRKIKLIFL